MPPRPVAWRVATSWEASSFLGEKMPPVDLTEDGRKWRYRDCTSDIEAATNYTNKHTNKQTNKER